MDIFKTILNAPTDYKFLRLKHFNRIVVLAPHCDDEVIGCGGTILRYLSIGAEVLIIYFTLPQDEKLAVVRKNEAISVWRKNDKVVLDFWSYPDSQLENVRMDAIDRMIGTIKVFRPEMILFPWVIDSHEDHRNVFYILYESLKYLDYLCDIQCYEIFHPLIANYIVNVTDVYANKENMLKQYQSQLRLNIVDSSLYLSRYRASCINLSAIKHAEAFYVTSSGQLLKRSRDIYTHWV